MIVIVIVLGFMVGSFLNAIIFRLHSKESLVSGRSHCLHCNHKLSSLDLIPVLSFIFLRGKCRYCQKQISWQYPIIELATTISFVLLTINYQLSTINFWFQAIFVCFLIVIAVYDFKHYLILDKVLIVVLPLVLIYNLITHKFLPGLVAGAGFSLFFLLQYLISRGRWIGFGDVKLGFVLGNFFGITLSAACLSLAYVSGAVVGLSLIVLDKKTLSSKLPFGTFLSASGIITLLYGDKILNWYLNLIGIK